MEELIKEILGTYHKIYKTSPIMVTIKFSENVYMDAYELAPDCDKANLKRNKNWVDTLNGTIIVPEYVGEDFYILINKAYKNREPFNWVGTLCHELTHIYDYIDIAKDLDSLRYKDYVKNKNSQMFEFWTEFHARARGHYCLRNYVSDGDIKNEYYVEENLKNEMPFQVNHLIKEYQANQDNFFQQVYAVVQFLGRLYVWEKLFPEYYTQSNIHSILGNNEWMEKLYYFLKEKDEYYKVSNSFEQMKEILEMNYRFSD